MFEFYNLFIENWHYVGLPENPGAAVLRLRLVVRDDLAGDLRRGGADRRLACAEGGAASAWILKPGPCLNGASCPSSRALSIAVGAALLIWPLAVARRRYLAAPVWLGFIFLLDPINARLGGESLIKDLVVRRDPIAW